jgi:hypothetical protein
MFAEDASTWNNGSRERTETIKIGILFIQG